MKMRTGPKFPAEGLKFLRALKRNNRREWFQPRREQYERFVRHPMAELVVTLHHDLARIAPEIVANPAVSLYRVYRDTRFSADKSPYKTYAGAIFPWRGLGKHSGAGLYFHVAPEEVLIAGGIYSPGPAELLVVRQHIADHFAAFRRIIKSARFRQAFGELEGEAQSRVPRGFCSTHVAAEYLKYRQFLAACVFPANFATSPAFYRTLLDSFKKLLPLVRFLNEPLLAAARRAALDPASDFRGSEGLTTARQSRK
jgi:uncharacterized protein (TIGR02453 family)